MKIISTGAGDILLVDLPEGARELKVFNDEKPYLSFFEGHTTPRIYLPEGYNYTILGRAKELTEEQWQSIVVTDVYYDPHAQPYPIPCYKDYIDDVWKWTASNSGYSFLKSVGVLLENQYGEWKEYKMKSLSTDSEYERRKLKHTEAQSKVKNPLVIKAEKIT